MPEFAHVDDVTRINDDFGVPVDIVRLIWADKAYYWETKLGEYEVGQQVAIKPPEYFAGSITPDLTPIASSR